MTEYNLMGFISDERDKSVLFLDYDIEDIEVVRLDLKSVGRKFSLHDFYLFETENGFHAWNPTLLDVDEVIQAIQYSLSDKNILAQLIRGYYGIRVFGDRKPPVFKQVLENNSRSEKPLSNPHLDFMEKILKIPVRRKENSVRGNIYIEEFKYIIDNG